MTNFPEHIFGLIGYFFKRNIFNKYFDRSKRRRVRAKIGLAGQQDRPLSKNYLQPCRDDNNDSDCDRDIDNGNDNDNDSHNK